MGCSVPHAALLWVIPDGVWRGCCGKGKRKARRPQTSSALPGPPALQGQPGSRARGAGVLPALPQPPAGRAGGPGSWACKEDGDRKAFIPIEIRATGSTEPGFWVDGKDSTEASHWGDLSPRGL